MLELVSVVIPVSGTKYLKESIDSICRQTYRSQEIIIIDSSDKPDEVKEILLQMGDERIVYFYQERSGVANALNFGISKASGQYIARMDADDIAFPDRIATQVKYMNEHPEIDATASSYMLIDKNGNCLKKEIKKFSSEEIKCELLFGNPICHPTMMFRDSIFEEGWRYHNVFAEDYDLWTRLVIRKKMCVMPEVLLKYRIHADNLSGVHVSRVNESDIDSALYYVNKLLGIHVDANKKWLLFRNYHLSQVSADEVGECGKFIITQYEFLCDLKRASDGLEDGQRKLIKKTILQRWRNIINMSNIIWPSKEVYDFPFEVADDHLFKSNMLGLIRNNDLWIKRMRAGEVRFFLYGFGERGHRTLKRYLRVREKSLRKWKLLGIIDKNKEFYSIGKKDYSTYDQTELFRQEFDYILISAYEFYDEIRTELLELHIPQRKIIRDNIIFFFGQEVYE